VRRKRDRRETEGDLEEIRNHAWSARKTLRTWRRRMAARGLCWAEISRGSVQTGSRAGLQLRSTVEKLNRALGAERIKA
jgi:hypothetical protein